MVVVHCLVYLLFHMMTTQTWCHHKTILNSSEHRCATVTDKLETNRYPKVFFYNPESRIGLTDNVKTSISYLCLRKIYINFNEILLFRFYDNSKNL